MTSQPIQPQNIVIQSNLNEMCDFSKICRICGANNRPVIPLFGHDAQQNQLVQKINEYLPIVVQQDDAYPLGICASCADSVMKWHELAQCCIKTDQALTLKLHATRRPSNNTHRASSGSADTHGEVHSRCGRDDLDGEMAVLADHLLARHTRLRIQCDVCKEYVGRYDYNWHVHRHAIQKIKAIEVETKRSYRKRIELRMIRTFPFYHIVRPRNLTGILPIKFHKISKSYNGGHRCRDGSRSIRLRYELEFTDSVTVLMGPDEQVCNCTKRATAAGDDNRRPETIRHDNHENNVGQSAAPDSPRAPRAPRTRRSARIAALRQV